MEGKGERECGRGRDGTARRNYLYATPNMEGKGESECGREKDKWYRALELLVGDTKYGR